MFIFRNNEYINESYQTITKEEFFILMKDPRARENLVVHVDLTHCGFDRTYLRTKTDNDYCCVESYIDFQAVQSNLAYKLYHNTIDFSEFKLKMEIAEAQSERQDKLDELISIITSKTIVNPKEYIDELTLMLEDV